MEPATEATLVQQTPEWPPPPPSAQMSAGVIAAIVIGVLLLAGGGVAAAVLLTRSHSRHLPSTIVGTTLPTTTVTETTSSTPGQAEGTTSTAATPPSPSTALPAPSMTIKRHFQELGAGEYAAAFALMSRAYRSANPNWLENREQGDPEIAIIGVGPPHYNGSSAHVYVRFYARDRNATTGSDTQCRLFKGFVEMIGGGDQWRYEPSGNTLSGTLVSVSACHV
jgi:hypothetical protein